MNPRNLALCAAALILTSAGCATRRPMAEAPPPPPMIEEPQAVETLPVQPAQAASPRPDAAQRAAAEEALGIKIEGLRLSAAGNMLNFRYRVVDEEKAAPLFERKLRPILLDAATGAALGVPNTPKLGQLRATGRGKIHADRVYNIVFANPGRYLKPGSEVALVMGEHRIDRIAVQ